MKYPDIKIKFWRELVLVLFALGIARALLSSLYGVNFREGVDEGHYFYYSLKVLEGGLPAFGDLFKAYLDHGGFWGFPSPLRFGFILESAIFCKLFGPVFVSLSFVSIFSFFCGAFFSYWIGRRIFGRDIAFLSTLLFLAAPLSLGLSRRALCDSASNFFLLTVLLLQISYQVLGRAPWKKWVISAVFFLALAFKETNILYIIPLAVSSLPFYALKDWRRALKDWVVMYILPATGILAVYILFFGSLREVFMALFFLPSLNAQGYAAAYQSGPWFRYLVDFLLVSPWVAILGFYYTLKVFADKLKKEELALALFIVCVIFVHSFFSKNLRYVSVIDYPLRVFTVMALYSFSSRSKIQFTFVFTAIAFFCLADAANFYNIFVKNGLYDPVSCGLFVVWSFVPKFI